MFNDLFSGVWNRQFLEDAECNYKKKVIKNSWNTFIFKADIKSGFALKTTNGNRPTNSKVSDFLNFSLVFTEQEGVIAQCSGLTHLDTLSVPSVIDYDTYMRYGTSGKAVNGEVESLQQFINRQNIDNIKDDIFVVDKSTFIFNGNSYVYTGEKFTSSDGFSVNPTEVFNLIENQGQWDKSVRVITGNEGKSLHGFMTKWFTKGEENKDWFKGVLDNADQSLAMSDTPGANFMGDSVSWDVVRRLNIITDYEITKEELKCLYLIPQHSKQDSDDNDWFYINSCNTYYDPKGRQVYSSIVFASLNDSLATSGQTIQGTVMPAAPGEGYAIPKIIFSEKGKAIDFEIDSKFTGDFGVQSIQMEIFGPALISGFKISGRPIEKVGQVNKIYPSRLLFVGELKHPITFNDTNRSGAENIFYVSNFTPDILSGWGDYIASQTTITDMLDKKKFEGLLMTPSNKKDDVMNSNKSNRHFVDDKWVLHKSTGDVFTYKQIDTRANHFCSVQYPNANKRIGTATFDIFGGSDETNIVNILNHNSIIHNQIETMPIVNSEYTTFTFSQLPILKNFISPITFGYPFAWRRIKTNINSEFPSWNGLTALIPKSLYNWYVESYWSVSNGTISFTKGNQSANGSFPINALKGGDGLTDVGSIVDDKAITLSFAFSLTDKISVGLATPKILSTQMTNISSLYLGSEVKDTFVNDLPTTALWTPQSKSLNPVANAITDIIGSGKYIIDAVGLIGINQFPIRITCFSNDPDSGDDAYTKVNYQTVIKSKSQYTKNVRDISTIYKTSYLDDFVESDVLLDYPKKPNYPGPEIDTYLPIEVEFKTTLKWKDFKGDITLVDPDNDVFSNLKPTGDIIFNRYYDEMNGYFIDNEKEDTKMLLYDFALNGGFNTFDEVKRVYDGISLDRWNDVIDSTPLFSLSTFNLNELDFDKPTQYNYTPQNKRAPFNPVSRTTYLSNMNVNQKAYIFNDDGNANVAVYDNGKPVYKTITHSNVWVMIDDTLKLWFGIQWQADNKKGISQYVNPPGEWAIQGFSLRICTQPPIGNYYNISDFKKYLEPVKVKTYNDLKITIHKKEN